MYHSLKLRLCTSFGNDLLFLTSPCNRVTSYKTEVSRCGLTISFASSPICVYIPFYLFTLILGEKHPFSWWYLRYYSMRQTTFMCSSLGECMNLLTMVTTYTIYGLMWDKYMSFLTSLWYLSLLIGTWSGWIVKTWFISMGVSIGLQFNMPVLVSTSSTYFRCHMVIPWIYLATSIPKKYLRFSRSFNSNSFVRTD